MKICRMCPKEAMAEQWSPDGASYWYCSKECEDLDIQMNVELGIVWRCLPAFGRKIEVFKNDY